MGYDFQKLLAEEVAGGIVSNQYNSYVINMNTFRFCPIVLNKGGYFICDELWISSSMDEL